MAQLAAVAEAERVVYERLKAELRTAAAVLAALCLAACYGFYGRVTSSITLSRSHMMSMAHGRAAL